MPVVGFDIEDGLEGQPRPQSTSSHKRAVSVIISLVTIVAFCFYFLKYSRGTQLELKIVPLRMGGDFTFKVHDAGNLDKMLLRLQVEKGKEYTMSEHSRRVVSRNIILPGGQQLPTNSDMEQDISLVFHFRVAQLIGQAVVLRFNCTQFSIRHKDPVTKQWMRPPIWDTMSRAVVNRLFTVTVAANGTILGIDANSIHEAVVSNMHQVGALPVEMTTALEVGSPSSAEGVYDSLGAQWNVPGQETIQAPVVYVDPPTACPVKGKATSIKNAPQIAGNVALVERGVCTFLQKVQLMQELNAVGVIVVDNVKIPSVLVDIDVGAKLKKAVTGSKDPMQVSLLTGVSAMKRKHLVGELGGDKDKKAQLPDFLGYNNMIEDQIKRRFTIFPGGAVGIGDTWHRKVKMVLEGQTAPTWVDEDYQLLDLPPPKEECERSRWSSAANCDQARTGHIRIAVNTSARQKGSTFAPADFGTGPLADDINIRESGVIVVDAGSGFLKAGQVHQKMTGSAAFTNLIISDQPHEGAYMKTLLDAQTEWGGGIKIINHNR